jgi:ribosomal protein S18 acetylase RimI-like enzyme
MHEVRPFRPTDLRGLASIWHACVDEGAWEGTDHAEVERQLEQVEAEPWWTLVADVAGTVAGSITPRLNDVSVAAAYRRRGLGTALVRASLELVRTLRDPYLLLYVPGGGDPPVDTPARRFAEACGLAYRATLTKMLLDDLSRVPEPELPSGVVLRVFDADREDTAAYVDLMNASFGSHPTPISWTRQQVDRAHAMPGFDTGGIALLARSDRPTTLIGFVRTHAEHDDAGRRFGEVALVGILPEWRGLGLGRALLRWSIARFRSLGLTEAELLVVAANDRALSIYRAEGFRTVVAWPQWSLDA